MASATTLTKPCSAFRKNEHAMIGGRPCKIVDSRTSKSGQSISLNGVDIFTGDTIKDRFPFMYIMNIPVVTQREYILKAIKLDGFCSLMDPVYGNLKDDLKMPEGELGTSIRGALNQSQSEVRVDVLSACDEHKIVGFKVYNSLACSNSISDARQFLGDLQLTLDFAMKFKEFQVDFSKMGPLLDKWIDDKKIPINTRETLAGYIKITEKIHPPRDMNEPLPSSSKQSGMEVMRSNLEELQKFLRKDDHQKTLEKFFSLACKSPFATERVNTEEDPKDETQGYFDF